MVQKEKEIKANTKFLKQEVHLHRETDVSAFFVLVGVQSPTKINAPRECTAILLGKCQQS